MIITEAGLEIMILIMTIMMMMMIGDDNDYSYDNHRGWSWIDDAGDFDDDDDDDGDMIITEAGFELRWWRFWSWWWCWSWLVMIRTEAAPPPLTNALSSRGEEPPRSTLSCRSLDHSVSLSKSFRITMISKNISQNHDNAKSVS